MDIFDKLIEIRKDKGVSLVDMSVELNIDRRSLFNYEKRLRKVPFKIIEGYAEYFGYELKLMLK